jgi:NtrC-family two-component system sensor histidine kinase KinB
MVLKRKLSLGIGFLFIIIFSLAIFCSYYVQKISSDSENVLRKNYNSIVYAKKMLLAAEDMRMAAQWAQFYPRKGHGAADYHAKLFEAGKREFDKNREAEKNNVTEIHENEYVDSLNRNYDLFLNLCLQMKDGHGGGVNFSELLPEYEKLRSAIVSINDVNMQAIVRKNQLTKEHSHGILISMAIIGTICILLAFGYLWYFPFYISSSISYVAVKMKELLSHAGIILEHEPDDELYLMLRAIDLLDQKFQPRGKKKR